MNHLNFNCRHYEAGRKYGSLFRENGIDICSQFKFTEEKYQFGQSCLNAYKTFYPEMLEEIQGVADGQRRSFDEIYTFISSMYCKTFGNFCTCFACRDGMNYFFGRNSDFIVALEDFYSSCFYQLDNSYSFLGNTTSFVQMEDGINEKGLAAGLTFIYPTVLGRGFNAGMLIRFILEKCSTVGEAMDKIKQLPIASSQTLTLADKMGNMVVAECNSKEYSFIFPENEKRFVVTANRFNSEKMKRYNVTDGYDLFSEERYITGRTALRNTECYSLGFVKDLLSGKMGFMCQYDRTKGADTVWSSIYDMNGGAIYRAEGNPSCGVYETETRVDGCWNKLKE